MRNQSEHSPEQDEIIKMLEQNGPSRANEIAKLLKKKYATVRWHLSQMANDGKIERLARGLYGIPGANIQTALRLNKAKTIAKPSHPVDRGLEMLNTFAKENPALVASGSMAVGAAAPRWVPVLTGVGVGISVAKYCGNASTSSTTSIGVSGLLGFLTFVLMDYTLRDDESLLATAFPRLRKQPPNQPLIAPSDDEPSTHGVNKPLKLQPVAIDPDLKKAS
ncbi:MAG TPA: helix-turn-helix domain-containing protein [Rhodothermales bacterium]|nr:helix-turn-helix domain-containing protein [Rhodothermales bacterium]